MSVLARARGRGCGCALSRYWNDKWNIRNKSCKTLFTRRQYSVQSMDAVEGRYAVLCNVEEVDERELSGPTLVLSPRFALHFAFPTLPSLSKQAEHPPVFCPDHPSLALSDLYTPLPHSLNPRRQFSRPRQCFPHTSLLFLPAVSVSVRVPTFIFRSLSCSASLLFPSLFHFDPRNGKSASRCHWVNTRGVWAIFGQGGRKEWSYSQSPAALLLHPSQSTRLAVRCHPNLCCQLSFCSSVRPRRQYSAKFLKRDKPQYNAALGIPPPNPPTPLSNRDPRYSPFFGRVHAWLPVSIISLIRIVDVLLMVMNYCIVWYIIIVWLCAKRNIAIIFYRDKSYVKHNFYSLRTRGIFIISYL